MDDFVLGDWVKFDTPAFGRCTGFVKTMGLHNELMAFRVHVTTSENPFSKGPDNKPRIAETVIGQELLVAMKDISHDLPEENREALIDIALMNKDEAWFTELTRNMNENTEAMSF